MSNYTNLGVAVLLAGVMAASCIREQTLDAPADAARICFELAQKTRGGEIRSPGALMILPGPRLR